MKVTMGVVVASLCVCSLAPTANAQKEVVPSEPVLPAAPGTPGAVPDAAVAPTPLPPDYQSHVRGHKPSPVWTQDRNFSSTRVWLLDPGTFQIETWWITRIYDKDPSSVRFLQEIEWGIAPHLQLDLYGQFRLDRQTNITEPNDDLKEQRYLSYKGWQAELRIAIPNYYGQIPLNPVVYVEWMSFADGDPSRAEARLLLGGAATKWLYLAANPYFELNVTPSDIKVGTDKDGNDIKRSRYLMDAEAGTTLAAGIRVTDWLNVSLQAKIGWDMLADEKNDWHFVFWAGPGVLLKPLPAKYQQYLKIIGTLLILMPGSDTNGGEGKGYEVPQKYEPTLIFASQF